MLKHTKLPEGSVAQRLSLLSPRPCRERALCQTCATLTGRAQCDRHRKQLLLPGCRWTAPSLRAPRSSAWSLCPSPQTCSMGSHPAEPGRKRIFLMYLGDNHLEVIQCNTLLRQETDNHRAESPLGLIATKGLQNKAIISNIQVLLKDRFRHNTQFNI